MVEDAQFGERVRALSRSLADGPTLAYAAIRHSVAFAAAQPLTAALDFEAEMMRWTGASADHRRAVEAFLAKQRPEFTGS